MVGVIPATAKHRSFADAFIESFGQGSERSSDLVAEMAKEQQKKNLRNELIKNIENQQGSSASDLMGAEGQEEANPAKRLQGAFSSQDPYSKAKAYAAAGEHDLAHVASQEAKGEEKRRAEERSIYKKSAERYFENLDVKKEKLENSQLALDAQTQAVMEGDIDPWSRGHLASLARDLGAPESVAALLETPGSKEFKTGLKTYLSYTLKDAFRGTTTGREIQLAEGLLAQAGSSKEANMATLALLDAQNDINQKEIEIVNELKARGVSPYDIPDQVSEILKPYRKETSKEYMEFVRHLKESGK